LKLTRKLVAALIVAICVVMATGAALQLRLRRWIDVTSTPEHGSRFEIVLEAELVAPQQAEAV